MKPVLPGPAVKRPYLQNHISDMRNLFVLAIVLAPLSLLGQNRLTGRVLDSSTGSPLEQVSVYFPQLENGAVTDADGQFFDRGEKYRTAIYYQDSTEREIAEKTKKEI